jgi:uncharacterized protein (DUF697 family)
MDSVQKVLKADFTRATQAERDTATRDIIVVCSFACAGLVLQPIPTLEQAVLPVQIGMVLAIAHIHGEDLSRKRATEILMDIAAITGVSIVGRQVLSTVAKVLLPGLGGLLAAPATFSVTWATGHAAMHYLRAGGRVDRDRIRKIFEEERERARTHYSEDKARANRPSAEDLSER